MATVGREFAFEQKDRVTEDAMANPSVARRLRRDLLVGVAIVVTLLLVLTLALLLLT